MDCPNIKIATRDCWQRDVPKKGQRSIVGIGPGDARAEKPHYIPMGELVLCGWRIGELQRP